MPVEDIAEEKGAFKYTFREIINIEPDWKHI